MVSCIIFSDGFFCCFPFFFLFAKKKNFMIDMLLINLFTLLLACTKSKNENKYLNKYKVPCKI